MLNYWCECLECGHSWIAQFAQECGALFAADSFGEECPECASGEIELGSEYRSGDL